MTTLAPAGNVAHGLAHPILAVGDSAANAFTAPGHGMTDGYRLWLLLQTAPGVVGGAPAATYVVKRLDDDRFQLQLLADSAYTTVENTADGTAVFLRLWP